MEGISEISYLGIRDYVLKTWDFLTRWHKDLVAAVVDEKIKHVEGTKWPLFISEKESKTHVIIGRFFES